jgi:hypothetical protein
LLSERKKTPERASVSKMKWTGPKLLTVAVGTFLLLGLGAAEAEESKQARNPYDPACAWGRIANGKGMLVRCLNETEAKALVSGKPVDGGEKPAPAEPEPAPTPTGDQPLSVEVGPIKADQGTIAIGQLDRPKDRYKECVEKNGGLEGDTGEVQVRFLVRGARSRAEGVSVSKRRNLSKEAAKCIADVVDRRKVGSPQAPMVGVTLTLSFSK